MPAPTPTPPTRAQRNAWRNAAVTRQRAEADDRVAALNEALAELAEMRPLHARLRDMGRRGPDALTPDQLDAREATLLAELASRTEAP